MIATSTIWQTYGHGVGATLSGLLAALAYRSRGAGRWARVCFATCALIANTAGIAKQAVVLAGVSPDSILVRKIWSLSFVAAAFCPVSVLIAWREQAKTGRGRKAARLLVPLSVVGAVWMSIGTIAYGWIPSLCLRSPLLEPFLSREFIVNLTLINALVLCVAGMVFLLPGTLERRRDRIAVAMMIGGLFLASASSMLYSIVSSSSAWLHILRVWRIQFTGLTVLGGLLYFSQFRSADIFAKRALRVLLGASIALGATAILWGPCRLIADRTSNPAGAIVLFTAAVVSLCIFLQSRLSCLVDLLVVRWIFGACDVPRSLLQLKEQIGTMEDESQIFDAARMTICRMLTIQDSHLVIGPASSKREGFPAVSVAVPGSERQMAFHLNFHDGVRQLVTAEWEVLEQIAIDCAQRLDELHREEERVGRVRRESQMTQQLIQAELRALRAQINPHFLFNSLNTIASLIVSDPEKAESMTVRLAHIFRYVLTHSDRSLASLEEEIDFLRTYLSIEQVRFGERLAVEFDLDPLTTSAVVPSLILQPLVENAIKHGIAPKIGRSRLVIRARRERKMLLLSVLDDGVGLPADPVIQRNSSGVGLNNIRERLQTMYGQGARLSLQAAAGGGSIAAITIPISE